MARRTGRIALAGAFAGTLALAAGAADLNGPMSSTPRPAASTAPAGAASAAAGAAEFDVRTLFAGTCGWCHSNGGRVAGKGPQLMDTRLTDAEIIHRIRNGKPGAMPAFGTAFSDEQLQAIVRYIRGLKPDGAAQ
jgi:mono/diheme cytochrome c family protein